MGISLTAGMRSNLINLQNTAKLMEQTAVRLNTGKKVNTALDDPISYFTAKNHMSRASDLSTLKNGMSEAIQTITAANNGIESIISLLDAAKAKAESAKSAETASSNITQTITLSSVTVGDSITIGGMTFTAGAISADNSNTTFGVGAGGVDSLTAANLATLINSNSSATNTDSINFAEINGESISLSISSVDMTADSVQIATNQEGNFAEGFVGASSSTEMANLQSQYNELLSQIDALVSDSAYKGTNLLNNDNLTVDFEGTNTLVVAGFDADYTNLDITAATWTASGSITTDIGKLETAVETLESEASTLASSLSIVTTRQDFTSNMINTLTTGADNLTLADMNEEGANMLMLQTQQALGTNSLSMSAQTAQGVLRLF